MREFVANRLLVWFLVVAGVSLPGVDASRTAHGQPQSFDSSSVVEVSTVWQTPRAHPGDDIALAVVIEVEEPYHINPDKSQIDDEFGFLIPTDLTVTEAAPALGVTSVQYPEAEDVEVAYTGEASTIKAYHHQVVLYVPVRVAADAELGEHAMRLALRVQSCDDTNCLMPATIDLPVTLEVVAAEVDRGEGDAELFAGYDPSAIDTTGGAVSSLVRFDFFGLFDFELDMATGFGFALVLLMAMVGGALLNFTPCVLPVIPIKIIGLTESAGSARRKLLLGTVMFLGVATFWVVIGAAIAGSSQLIQMGVLDAGGGIQQSNQLFQYWQFTIPIGIFIAVMAVGMCGLFSVNLPNWIYMINPKQDTVVGSFGFGVMTAILSTPCTAPFMGAAAGAAAAASSAVALLTFLAIGVGMGLPYFVLSARPQLVDFLPRTGPGSELLKQVMGLLMLAAAAFFIGNGVMTLITAPGESVSPNYWWAVVAMVVAAGGWLAYRTFRITPSLARRASFTAVGVLLMAASVAAGAKLTAGPPIDWVKYTPDAFDRAIAEDRIIVMDFTAEWCLNCKALEQAVLYDPSVVEVLKREGVVPMKVDITSSDNEVGRAKLQSVGRVMIPLLVVFGPDGEEVFKSDAYTIRQVLDAVERAGS